MKEEGDVYFSKDGTEVSDLERNEWWDGNERIDLSELIVGYERVKNGVEVKTGKCVEIKKERFRIEEGRGEVREGLKEDEWFKFLSLFRFDERVEEVVSDFLGILEM
ncbi:hypothetical protein [Staphylococcus epidermidis]|uniref:hypothetical protein n=1 Tax=Staphylococcus epidermidis TaxID=1282 RepID=UPI00119CFF59|nr:hypothetical protein [Staphylococcus epidermidis]